MSIAFVPRKPSIAIRAPHAIQKVVCAMDLELTAHAHTATFTVPSLILKIGHEYNLCVVCTG
jgi:hypothetical protein